MAPERLSHEVRENVSRPYGEQRVDGPDRARRLLPDSDEQRHWDGDIREGKQRSRSRRIAAGPVVLLHSPAHGHGRKYERYECPRQGGAVGQGRSLNHWRAIGG